MIDWLRKRRLEENQLEKIVDDIENPVDPARAPSERFGLNAKNALWAVAIVVVIVAAIFVLIR
jgi:hypothetical protein